MHSSSSLVFQALQHRETQKIPFDLGANANTGIHIKAYTALREYLGLSRLEEELQDQITQRAVVHEDLKKALKIDVDGLYPSPPRSWTFSPFEEGEYSIFTDSFGITWRMPLDKGLYYDMYRHPLQSIDPTHPKDLERYPLPDPIDPARFAGWRERIDRALKKERPILINSYHGGLFETALWLRGFEDLFMDMAMHPSFVEALLDRILEERLAYWERVLHFIGDAPVIVGEADDLAGQESTLISPAMYRQFIKPRHRELFSFIKERAFGECFLFYHSCGALYPLLPDLIEVGVDIINPVQYRAKGMDRDLLKREFGDVLTFWGGGVDTQRVLPRGTPKEVREETRRSIEAFAPGGGFVFSAVHSIQADVPPENIMAMWEVLSSYSH